MIDRPMDATEHPDEGLIHAWLDDALDAAEAERLASHVQTCAECQARVAEARGLIAGASRIVAALDDAPAGTRQGWAQSAVAGGGAAAGSTAAGAAGDSAAGGSLWRWLRVTPGRAALAATILVAIGITLTYERTAVDYAPRSTAAVFNPQKADVPAATSPEGAASDAAKPRDALLDSAVAKNVTIAQGRRTVEAARGPIIPSAPPPSTTLQAPPNAAGEAVALGRAEAEARRESAAVLADRSRAGITGAVASRREPTSATASVEVPQAVPAPVAPVQSQQARDGARMALKSQYTVAKSCLRLESPDADARWADQPFPLVLAVEPGPVDGPRDAAVLTPSGETTSLRAQWIPRGADSVSVRLRRIGYSGSIALGPEAGSRSGIAVSAAAPTALEEVVVSSAPAQARADRRAAAPAPAQSAPAAGPPVRQLRVTARSIGCPAR
ncbi:MAG: zf-HC2 domain-containing protein [Gemmatimonadaceae bacterium]